MLLLIISRTLHSSFCKRLTEVLSLTSKLSLIQSYNHPTSDTKTNSKSQDNHQPHKMSSTKKIITVFGATGNQGGSIARAILSDPKASSEFAIRGVTRDTSKPKAQELAKLGAELVSADLDDADAVRKAVKGSYGVYAVTNYWESLDHEKEIRQGKAMADAAKAEGVQHLVWSSLVNATELSKGTLPGVFHFDSKAAVEAYIREIGVPATFLMPGFFMSGVVGSSLRRGEDGKYTLAMAMPEDTPIPLFAPELDSGKYAKAVFQRRDEVLGKRVLEATAYVTPGQMLRDFKEQFPKAGESAQFFEMPEDMLKGALQGMGMPEFAAQELWENMALISRFGYFGGESLDWSNSLVTEPLTTWKEYLKQSPSLKDVE